jgi:hypothetical protein
MAWVEDAHGPHSCYRRGRRTGHGKRLSRDAQALHSYCSRRKVQQGVCVYINLVERFFALGSLGSRHMALRACQRIVETSLLVCLDLVWVWGQTNTLLAARAVHTNAQLSRHVRAHVSGVVRCATHSCLRHCTIMNTVVRRLDQCTNYRYGCSADLQLSFRSVVAQRQLLLRVRENIHTSRACHPRTISKCGVGLIITLWTSYLVAARLHTADYCTEILLQIGVGRFGSITRLIDGEVFCLLFR